jgi:hypothetical protein|tara:strand:+ start:1836 stop:2027 length:192 start_codon:yes stop_codon:yes gene_type:complete
MTEKYRINLSNKESFDKALMTPKKMPNIKANIIEAHARKNVLKKVEDIILETGTPVLTKDVLK